MKSLENERADLGLRDRRLLRPAASLRLVALLFVVIFFIEHGFTLALFGGGCASQVCPGRGLGLGGVAGLRPGFEVNVESAGFSGRRMVPARSYGWGGGFVGVLLSQEK